MDIGPVFGISDSLASPRRTEGIRALHFEIGASARTGDDHPPSRQYAADPGMADDDAADLELDEESNEASEIGADPLRGAWVNFTA